MRYMQTDEAEDPLQAQLQSAWQKAVAEITGEAIQAPLPTPSPLSQMLNRFSTRYGFISAQGVLVRLGRAFARQLLPTLGATLPQFQSATFRLMPRRRKTLQALQALSEILSPLAEIHVKINAQTVEWLLPAPPSEAKEGGTSPFWAGFVQEAIYWASGGRLLPVRLSQSAVGAVIQTTL